jgi:alcohol dehydrogenase (cytochrome c)
MEMAGEDQLSNSERHDPDRLRRRLLGDMGGNFYAVDGADGRKLWGRKIGGAVGGGVITYAVDGKQKVAVAHGLTEIPWPTEITTAKVSVIGLE